MSEQRRPSETRKPARRASSRTVAIGAVVLLIIVAIAGIVLADRHPAVVVSAAAPAASVARTEQVASAPTAANPNEVIFAAGSPKLPSTAGESIARFAESARGGGNVVRISVRYLTGDNKVRDRELATARSTAVREALKADGVGAEKMQDRAGRDAGRQPDRRRCQPDRPDAALKLSRRAG